MASGDNGKTAPNNPKDVERLTNLKLVLYYPIFYDTPTSQIFSQAQRKVEECIRANSATMIASGGGYNVHYIPCSLENMANGKEFNGTLENEEPKNTNDMFTVLDSHILKDVVPDKLTADAGFSLLIWTITNISHTDKQLEVLRSRARRYKESLMWKDSVKFYSSNSDGDLKTFSDTQKDVSHCANDLENPVKCFEDMLFNPITEL